MHHSGVGSKGWLAEHNYFSWSKPPGAKQQDSPKADADHSVTEAKPELLAWRSRLKGYRLGARLARGRDSDSDQPLPGTVATSSTNETRQKPHVALVSESSEDSPTNAMPTPSLENGELQLPLSVGFLPERNRPDIVVD